MQNENANEYTDNDTLKTEVCNSQIFKYQTYSRLRHVNLKY